MTIRDTIRHLDAAETYIRSARDCLRTASDETPELRKNPPLERPIGDTVRVTVNSVVRDVPLEDSTIFNGVVRVYATSEPGGCAVVVCARVAIALQVEASYRGSTRRASRRLAIGDAIIMPVVSGARPAKARWVADACVAASNTMREDRLWPDANYNAPAGHGIGPSCFKWQLALGGGPGEGFTYRALARQAWPTIWRPDADGNPTVATDTRYWQGRQTGQMAGWGGESAQRDRWAPDAEHFSRLYAPAVALLDAGIDSGLARLVLRFAWADVKSDWSLHPDYPRVSDPNSGVLWAGLAQATELARTAAFRPPAGNPWMNRGYWHRVRVLEACSRHGIISEDETAEYAAGYLQLAAALTDRHYVQNRTAPDSPSPGDIGQFWGPPHNLGGSLTSVWQQMLVNDGLRRLNALPGGEGAVGLTSEMTQDGTFWPYALDAQGRAAGMMPGGWNYPVATNHEDAPYDIAEQAKAGDALVNPLDWISDADFDGVMGDLAD